MFSRVLYIGTSPDGKGGLATVVRMYRDFIGTDFRYVCSHIDGAQTRKVRVLIIAVLKAIYWCASRKVDVVHIHSSSHLSFYRKSIFVLIARFFSCKVIMHIHGGLFLDFIRVHKRYCRYILLKADRIVTVSKYLEKGIRSTFPELRCLETIYNPISSPRLREKEDCSSNGRLDILFLGTINHNKGSLDILRCMEQYRDYFSSRVVVHIGGVGELVDELKLRVATPPLCDFVIYHGWLDGEKKNDLLWLADVYLQPSYFESLGISILEAMSYGTAIIGSNRGGIPELIKEGETGLLIEPGDPEQLFRALKCLIENKEVRLKMAHAGCLFAKQAYVPSIVAQLEELYSKLMVK